MSIYSQLPPQNDSVIKFLQTTILVLFECSCLERGPGRSENSYRLILDGSRNLKIGPGRRKSLWERDGPPRKYLKNVRGRLKKV